jgi:hypothetical protein
MSVDVVAQASRRATTPAQPPGKDRVLSRLTAEARQARQDAERAHAKHLAAEQAVVEYGRAARARSLLDAHNACPSPELLRAWEALCREMREMVDGLVFDIWLADVHPHRFVDGVWWLACPVNSRDWIETRFGRLWEKAAQGPVRFVICDINQGRASWSS